MPIKPDDRTEIDLQGGSRVYAPNQAVIDPPNLGPVKISRFQISEPLVAKVEAIARARVKIARYVNTSDVKSLWESEDHQMALAMSVNASSQIEGEEIHASLVPLILNETTKPDEDNVVTPELAHRLDVARNIFKAYFWALTSKPKAMLSTEFILEVHRRMFSGTEHYSGFAGKFKEKEVVVSGRLYHVRTLPAARVSDAIERLCERVNSDFEKNRNGMEKPLLTIVAEFVLDFLAIHPFRDGNGRTARLLSTYLLERIGYHFSAIYPIDSVINERRAEYFRALFSGQRNWYTEHEDLTHWVEFYIDAVFEQWERAYRKIKRANEIERNRAV